MSLNMGFMLRLGVQFIVYRIWLINRFASTLVGLQL